MASITTPQQLSNWVESLLVQVESRLGERNRQVEMRSTYAVADEVNEMAERIDALESSIQGTFLSSHRTGARGRYRC